MSFFFLHRLIKAPRIMSLFFGRDSCSGIFFIVIVYFFSFEFAGICLSYRLLDGDIYSNFGDFHSDLMLLEAFGWRFLFKILRFPFRFDAFGGFWMKISIQILLISIEI